MGLSIDNHNEGKMLDDQAILDYKTKLGYSHVLSNVVFGYLQPFDTMDFKNWQGVQCLLSFENNGILLIQIDDYEGFKVQQAQFLTMDEIQTLSYNQQLTSAKTPVDTGSDYALLLDVMKLDIIATQVKYTFALPMSTFWKPNYNSKVTFVANPLLSYLDNKISPLFSQAILHSRFDKQLETLGIIPRMVYYYGNNR